CALGVGINLVLVQRTCGGGVVWLALGGMAVFALWLYVGTLRHGQWRLPAWWKLVLLIYVFWSVRTYLGGDKYPNVFNGWIPMILCFLAAGMLRRGALVTFAVVVNFALPAVLIEWYVAPMEGQVQRVAS